MISETPAPQNPHRTKKLNASDVVASLKRDISDAKFTTNERLPAERELAETFGIARGTLREALKQLEAQGYVERRAGSGTYVIYVGDESLRSVVETTRPLDLVDARFALEPHICRLAVLQATDRDLDRAELVLRRMETCKGNIEAYAEGDEDFHMLLADITGNAMIKWMMTQVCKVRGHTQWARMRALTLDEAAMKKYNAEHRAILAAIRAREPENAADHMKAHLSAARISLMDAMQA